MREDFRYTKELFKLRLRLWSILYGGLMMNVVLFSLIIYLIFFLYGGVNK